jgi:hypothetical protein
MKRIFLALVVLVMFSIVVFHGPLSAAAQGASEAPPVQVVVVSGTNYEMGVQYGQQAANLIAAMRDEAWNILNTQVMNSAGKAPLGHCVIVQDIKVWTYYLEKYDPKLKEWLLGISQGCANEGVNVTYADLVAIMVYPQELWARPQMPYPPETGVTPCGVASKSQNLLAKGRTNTKPVSSCTSLAATGNATQGGIPMVSITGGATLDTPQYLILIAFPSEGQQFISLTQAGRVATNLGANSQFSWTMPAAVTAPLLGCPSSWGVTSEVYFHYLQQYCKSPRDAVTYLNDTPKGGVTGLFVFANKSGDVFIDECGSCGCVIRKPGDTYENKDFVATTNNYNSPAMEGYNLGAAYFPDTFFRYATIFQELYTAPAGTVGLHFAKAAWLSDNWYDPTCSTTAGWPTCYPAAGTAGIWNTVPVADNPNDPNTCNVPGNLCEGGEYQMISFPAQQTVYLERGDPQGTAVAPYYWPTSPEPTGEYTKWQLLGSIDQVAGAASNDAMNMLQIAWNAYKLKAPTLSPGTQQSLESLLVQASEALSRGQTEAQSAQWSGACTDFATAQLYSQMVTTQLNQ